MFWSIIGAVIVVFISIKIWDAFRNWATREWILKNVGKDLK